MSVPFAIQDLYPEHRATCYGCGRLNEHGYGLRTVVEGDEAVSRFTPEPFHTAVPGVVYGGLLASLLDCHSMAVAAWGLYRAAGRELDDGGPPLYCATGTLTLRYRRPTPLGPELTLRGTVRGVEGRKVLVEATLEAAGEVRVVAEVVALQMPEDFGAS